MQNTPTLTDNEMQLIDMIRTHKDPAKAFIIAVEIITDFLKEMEESENKERATK